MTNDYYYAVKAAERKAAQIERCYGEGYVDFKYFCMLVGEEVRIRSLQKKAEAASRKLR
ncbi:MAG: hypothetical protein IKD89_08240 [Clostridia bacterium]|nr:hypothetical protein [Clostridia bacterium]